MNEDIRQRLRTALAESSLDPTTLARRIGRGRDYIRDFLDDRKDSLGAAVVPAIERELGLEPGFLLGAVTPPTHRSRIVAPPSEPFGERDLPIYAAAEGGTGEMVISTDPIEIVPRPWYLRNVKEGYGVIVIGESMSPKFEPGDIVIVNPRLPALRSKPAIFVAGEDTGSFTATVKMLVRETAGEWRVRQYNPAQEFNLAKKTWRKALRIVGTYEGV